MNVYAGPPRAMTRVTLRLVPLTPVHIGDGTEWRPDEYLIDAPRSRAWSDEEGDAPATPYPSRVSATGAVWVAEAVAAGALASSQLNRSVLNRMKWMRTASTNRNTASATSVRCG